MSQRHPPIAAAGKAAPLSVVVRRGQTLATRTRTLAARLYRRFWLQRLYANVLQTGYDRRCLIRYIVEPFRLGQPRLVHQNEWQVVELARTVGSFGFNVDVISHDDGHTRLRGPYHLIIDIHPGPWPPYRAQMAPGCRRVGYLTGSNPTFANAAEAARIEACFQRTGVRLQPRRATPPFDRATLESLDAIFFIGNRYNLESYAEFDLPPVHFIKNSGYNFLRSAAFSRKSPCNFVFLAGSGQVHKGLDLLLEIFAAHPELQLTVCSHFQAETDFCRLYAPQLFQRPNIVPAGFQDIAGPRFRQICDRSSYLVLPSASEASAGNVLTGMSAGLVPIVSRECGFEADEVMHFDRIDIPSMTETLLYFAAQPPAWIEQEGRQAMETVRSRYSMDAYRDSVRAALAGLLASEPATGDRAS